VLGFRQSPDMQAGIQSQCRTWQYLKFSATFVFFLVGYLRRQIWSPNNRVCERSATEKCVAGTLSQGEFLLSGRTTFSYFVFIPSFKERLLSSSISIRAVVGGKLVAWSPSFWVSKDNFGSPLIFGPPGG
jgi:hypothetical protein